MNTFKDVFTDQNTIVVFLKSDLQQEVFDKVREVREAWLNPVGGWEEWKFDQSYFWQNYIQTRSSLPTFEKLCEQKAWCEVGFSPLPFLKGVPLNWNVIGLTEHPLLWIEKAYQHFHQTPGDGVSQFLLEKADYAKLWCLLSSRIDSYSKTVLRLEDVLGFSYAIPVDQELWAIVAEQAERFGYTSDGFVDDFVWKKPTVTDQFNDCSPVSIIIAARNNGPFLSDAIHSAMRQSYLPKEVIYVDDGSTDDSVKIAEQFPIKILKQEWKGVVEARNSGAREAKGKYLLFLDGDDILTNNYVEVRLGCLFDNPTASFCYGPLQDFGIFNEYHDFQEWSPKKLWAGNFCNSTTLLVVDHFWEVGGWREGIGTDWDWDLFLRMAKFGYHGIRDKKAALLYRRHSNSITCQRHIDGEVDPWSYRKLKYMLRNINCRTQISTVLSDRLIELFPRWLEVVVENVKFFEAKFAQEKPYNKFASPLPPKPNLYVLYTGSAKHRDFVNREVEKVAEHFNAVTIRNQEESASRKDPNEVARFMARSCNTLFNTDCELVWFLEDDVIPPVHAMHALNEAILFAPVPLYAAAGIYRNRHDPKYYIAHNWPNLHDSRTIQNFKAIHEDMLVDCTGTGCTMIFKPFASHPFGSHLQGVPAHDWNWCFGLKRYDWPLTKKVLLLANVECQHYCDRERFV